MKPSANLPQKKNHAALWISAILAAGTLLAFWPVTKCGFVNFDDTDFVTANPVVQAGLTWKGFRWVWSSEVARNWHPITMLSHMVDCQLFKLQPAGHHATNLLLHAANVLLLFHLLRRMTGFVWRAAFVAALFAWHPLHVESVVWIAERKDVLSTLFWLLSMWTYVSYVRALEAKNRNAWRFYVLTLIFLALGLMSKPMLVTAPFLFLLIDFWPLGRMKRPPYWKRLIWEKAPMAAMSIVLCVITYSIQKNGGAMLTENNLPFGSRVENAFMSYVRYLGNMFWPEHLAGLYMRSGQWPLWQVALAALAVLGVSIIAFAQARRRPWLAAGWFWYLGTLVPVIGIVQVGMQSMADRFTYVPLIGIFIILTWGICELAVAERWPASSLGAAAFVVLTICMALTRHQIGYWTDSETFFKHMLAAGPHNCLAHYNLANLYSRQKRMEEAKANYEAALADEPNFPDAHNNYGGVLLDEKNYDEAIRHYRDAVRLNPQYLYVFNLANALADSASARHAADQFAEAVRTYGEALTYNPHSADAHLNLGLTWEAQGKQREAMAEFEKAIEIAPQLELAQFKLAETLAGLGSLDEAETHYRAAIALNPEHAESYEGLGVCYERQNRNPEATEVFKQLAVRQPNNASANGNLANALAVQNRFDEAIPYYIAALRLAPADFRTEFNFGYSLARAGRLDEAETHYRRALQLNPNYTVAERALEELQKARTAHQ